MAPRQPPQGRSLADLRPDVAVEWHPTKNQFKPENFRVSSGQKAWWLGTCGHEWDDSISHRTGGRGCPICSGRRVVKGINDLATTHPEIAAEWHPAKNGGLVPSEVVAGSHKKVWWFSHGHEWQAMIDNRTRHDHGCSVCRGFTVQAGVNDLGTIAPEIAAEWHPTRNKKSASETMASSHSKAWFLCSNGHDYCMELRKRVNRGMGCPTCANRVVLVGFNDLVTTNPSVAAEWHPTKNGDLFPTQFVEGSARKIWWLCSVGHDWRATIVDRKRFSCPTCSATGFSSFEDGWIYLLTHETWSMQKIGITNNPDQRIGQHADFGWQLAEIRGPMPGDHIRALERAGLTALRIRGAALGQVGSNRKFNGHTESWPTGSLRLENLNQLIEWIRDDESTSVRAPNDLG